ncbi:unnamed protein product, partial [Allacma fusca]
GTKREVNSYLNNLQTTSEVDSRSTVIADVSEISYKKRRIAPSSCDITDVLNQLNQQSRNDYVHPSTKVVSFSPSNEYALPTINPEDMETGELLGLNAQRKLKKLEKKITKLKAKLESLEEELQDEKRSKKNTKEITIELFNQLLPRLQEFRKRRSLRSYPLQDLLIIFLPHMIIVSVLVTISYLFLHNGIPLHLQSLLEPPKRSMLTLLLSVSLEQFGILFWVAQTYFMMQFHLLYFQWFHETVTTEIKTLAQQRFNVEETLGELFRNCRAHQLSIQMFNLSNSW